MKDAGLEVNKMPKAQSSRKSCAKQTKDRKSKSSKDKDAKADKKPVKMVK